MEKPNRPLVPVSPTAIPLASAAIDDGFIQSRIFTIRGVQVMLSPDLADLYQVETRSFNQAVKRNAERFPPGFRVQLTGDELREVITNCDNPDRLRFSPQKPPDAAGWREAAEGAFTFRPDSAFPFVPACRVETPPRRDCVLHQNGGSAPGGGLYDHQL